jgi:hypothetical protein
VQQISGVDGQSSDTHRGVQRRDVAVAVGADGRAGEGREFQAADLLDVTRGAAGDQAHGAEGLIAGAHHFAERGRDGRVVQVLKHDEGRPWDLLEAPHLFIQGRIR